MFLVNCFGNRGAVSGKRSIARSLLSTTAVLGLLSGAPVFAQTQEGADEDDEEAASSDPGAAEPAEQRTQPAGGDIVVTATRSSTLLQRTPVAVGVVGGEDLTARNLNRLRDLSSSVAGFQVPAPATPSISFLFIRGIGTTSPTYSGAVGVYMDDIYQGRVASSAAFGLPDVERIEVLRGPQGTLYGQNTSAGAIKIVSVTPGDTTQGLVQASVGDYGQYDVRGYVAGPLIEGVLSGSVAFAHEEVGGITYNSTLDKDVNAVRTDQGRLKLRYRSPQVEGLEITGTLYGQIDRSDTPAYSSLVGPDANPRVTTENRDLQKDDYSYLASLNVDYALNDEIELRSITGYHKFSNEDFWSLDGSPADIFAWNFELGQKQFSQEFQLLGEFDTLSLSAGLIYYDEEFDVNRPNVIFGNYSGIRSNTSVESFGIYAQGRWMATERLGVTLGGRYYDQDDEFSIIGYQSDEFFSQGPTTFSATGLETGSDGFTPKVGLDYQFTDDLFGYASFTRGEKSGGFNPVSGSAVIATIPVDAEKVTTYEAGLKFNTPSRSVTINTAIFYNDFRDFQSLIANAVINGQLINGSVAVNAQKAETYGAEIEARFRPVDGLEAFATATFLSATFLDFTVQTSGATTDYSGNRLPYTSDTLLSGGLSYTAETASGSEFKIAGQVKYTSDAYSDIANDLYIPEQTYVDLDVSWTSPDRHWTIFGRVRNLLDDTYILQLAPPLPGINAAVYNAPRMFNVGARFDF